MDNTYDNKYVFIEIFLGSGGIKGKTQASAFIFLLALLHKFDTLSLKFIFYQLLLPEVLEKYSVLYDIHLSMYI